ERAPVPLDDMLDDGETKTRAGGFAAARRIDAVEALRDTRQMLSRDAGTMIGDRQRDPAAAAPRGNLDPRVGPVAAVAHGIAEQIVDDLDQLCSIAWYCGKALGNVDGELALTATAHVRSVGER